MENCAFAEIMKLIKGLKPSADLLAGGVASDVVNAKGYKKIVFVLDIMGEGSTGKGTVTINATAAANTSSPTAIPFKYSILGSGVEDGQGSLTACAAAGFQTTAGVHRVYIIEVDPRDLPDAKPYVHLASTEDTNDPVVGNLLTYMMEPRAASPYLPTALS